ncbi:2-oxoacid:ferredoxin oxidoreductase subunit beta [Methanococcus maripaludis]|uniref:2-oxoglutarate ferredoxin oxidoreductase subunit beta n=1 Tax=Methanococcus maripaludis TaxID=39152 RepID=A0A2L1CC04_METMI|nr:2-oxoacid:ferredoxin oxidoreductase subunit beta [Methanococcus maripaludis]AVB76901.1 2-oxoglutarate oxidoreductase subunit KorB [Methanococcus maripaludis]MBA2863411.1 2-oxoglutarate ferredoxin oxidoreductase subunit beta [Methanococcus maripaludis]MBB6496585.1 2-oxoglutarate ferredoxin oxidoreductase subunit beta [Methanococcus maripaludis]
MHPSLKYMRKDRLPHIFCSGCGNGIVLNCFTNALDKLALKNEDYIAISGIGCSSRVSGYLFCDSLHTTHGRPIAFALGTKVIQNDKKVVVFTGDGDLSAIGGNHFIHGCRRNIDITVICINNNIYGMTGGQCSPTTPHEKKATTAPYGNPENPLDLCELAKAAGATYVARWTTANPIQLANSIKKGMEKKGFSFIEVVSQCPTYYGRFNVSRKPSEMMKNLKESAVTLRKSENMETEELLNKIVVGEFLNIEKPEYVEQLKKLQE